MKLGRYQTEIGAHLCRIENDRIADLTAAGFGISMRDLMGKLDTLRGEIAAVPADGPALSDVTLLAPIDDPQKFLALGMNYKEHAEKARAAGIKVPDSQLWFNKQVTCIAGPYEGTELPKVTDKLDFEAELGFVIGKAARRVSAADALSVIGGYLVANDVSARDWQMRSPTFTLGKSFDTHGPIGPWITTSDEVADPQALDIKAWVNGALRQSSNTSDMIYPIAEQIAYITQVFTLLPGDVLITGTPSGTGIETDSFLSIGDVVRVEIEGLGHIENEVVAEV